MFRSAFYDRLTPALASVLCQLVDWMPPETLTPEDVAEAYGLRWQVELLYSTEYRATLDTSHA